MERPIPKPRKSLLNKVQAEIPICPELPPIPPRIASREPPPRPPPPLPPQFIGFEKFNLNMEEDLNSHSFTIEALDDQLSYTSSITSQKTPTSSLSNGHSFNNYEELTSLSAGVSLENPNFSEPNEHLRQTYIEPLVYSEKSEGESICFAGWASISGLKKESQRFWAIIRKNKLLLMENDETEETTLPHFDLSNLVYVGGCINEKNALNLAFKNISQCKISTIKLVPEDNADFWLVLLAKSICPVNETLQNATNEVSACGNLWIRQGVTGIWTEGWAKVHNHHMFYWIQGFDVLFEADLRKSLIIKRDVPESDWCNRIEHSSSLGPLLLVQHGSSIYVQSEFDQCTNLWFEFLQNEITQPGKTLESSRLTSDDVPIIVDKCIQFITTYGINQQGIYRKNGSASEARILFEELKRDPINAHLKPVTDETVNAVADILRSYFRQLESPLIPVKFHEQLYQISEMTDFPHKLNSYYDVLCQLPTVHLNTLRKLLDHLKEVTAHANINLATVENLSKVFGPTVFTVDKFNEATIDTYSKTGRQIFVIRDLLKHYTEIFQPSEVEIQKKLKMDEFQEKANLKTPAKGFLFPIHLYERDNKCFNVQTDWQASDVVSFKLEKLNMESFFSSYALFEVVKNGQLERRICGNETINSIVFGRWLEWEHPECFILMKKDSHPFQPHNIRAFVEDVKIAEPGSKFFKSAQLKNECSTRVIQYSKNLKSQNEWNIDKMVWFLGHEADRKPPHPYTLTFLLTDKSKYKTKFAGYCLSFKDDNQRIQWLNSMIISKQEYLETPLIQLN